MASLTETLKQNLLVKVLLTNVFALLFLFLSLFVVIKPAVMNIFKLKQQYSKYVELSQKLNEKIDKLTAYNLAIERQDRQLKMLNFLFPYDYNYSYLLTVLEQLAQATDVKLLSVSYSKNINSTLAKNFRKEGITLLSPVTFAVTFEGSLRQMAEYIKLLEQTPFKPQIVNLTYSQKDNKNQDKETYTITFVVYKTNQVISLSDMYDLR